MVTLNSPVPPPIARRIRPRGLWLLLAVALLALGGTAWGQEIHVSPGSSPENPAGVTPQIHPAPTAPAPASTVTPGPKPANSEDGLTLVSNVNLVLVPVTVSDPFGRMVTGLEKENFSVTEDNVPQKIKSFSSEDAPISVGVVFDCSGSMSDKIQKSREALMQFFRDANPSDEFFVVDFADQPRLLVGFTNNVDKVEDDVQFIQPNGRTALLDAVYLALEEMRNAKYQRKALLIISDGGDNHSRYTEGELRRAVREADVQIYAVGLFSEYGGASEEEARGPDLLREITDATGGRTFSIHSVEELPDVANKIGIELRSQYVLGYEPSNLTPDGKWRKLAVKLHQPAGLPPLSVSARTGYFGPGM